ncbi:MAG: nuclear transport factor 2 family protein [Woeseiaceae bacterium]|nr:nuclear transport factor 2 family protein [Woeseiaceae bacterium]
MNEVSKPPPLHAAAIADAGSSANKQLVLEFFAAADRGDLDAAIAMLADDVTWTNIGSTKFSGRYEGKQALMDELLGPVFGQFKAGIATTIERLTAEGDIVVAQSDGQAETVDGVPYNNTYCQVFRIRDGQITEVKEYFDTALADSVLGSG